MLQFATIVAIMALSPPAGEATGTDEGLRRPPTHQSAIVRMTLDNQLVVSVGAYHYEPVMTHGPNGPTQSWVRRQFETNWILAAKDVEVYQVGGKRLGIDELRKRLVKPALAMLEPGEKFDPKDYSHYDKNVLVILKVSATEGPATSSQTKVPNWGEAGPFARRPVKLPNAWIPFAPIVDGTPNSSPETQIAPAPIPALPAIPNGNDAKAARQWVADEQPGNVKYDRDHVARGKRILALELEAERLTRRLAEIREERQQIDREAEKPHQPE